MKKSLAAVALAGSIALVGAVPAMAVTPYPAPPAQGTVSDGTVAPGEAFTFSGTGFTAGEAIVVTVTPTGTPQALGGAVTGGGVGMAVPGKITMPLAAQTFNTKADANGNFAITLTINEPGTYTLAATGQTSGKIVTATVKVAAAAGTTLANTGGGTGTALANTGADASLLLWTLVGGGALAAGITSVVVVRRRAKADVAA